MLDSEDDSEAKIPQNDPSFVQPTDQVKPPRPFVQPVNPKIAIPKPKCKGYSRNKEACFRHVVPTVVLTQSTLVPITTVRPVTTDVPKTNVTRPRQVKTVVTKTNSPPRRHINRSPSPTASNFPLKVTAAKASMVNVVKGNPQHALKDKRVIDSGCLRHMTGNMSYLSDFEELNGGYVSFGGNSKGGKISGKGKIRTGKLDFDDVCFIKELKFNLFSVSQMCDKKNSVLFTDNECLVLSPEFKLPDANQVLLRVSRENNMYNVDLKNIVPSGDLTCLFAKATLDESNLWHRRLGHINFKTMNKLVKDNLVRGLSSKVFENDHTCVACKKGKQHRASCKFDGKVDEVFLVGYSVSSKVFSVFNSRTSIVQETLHINFLENKPNVAGSGLTRLFDIDTLIRTMNYHPVTAGNQSNPSAGVQEQFNSEKAGEENVQQYPEFERRKPESKVNVSSSSSAQNKKHDDKTKREAKGKSHVESVAGPSNAAVSPAHGKSSYFDTSLLTNDPNMPELKDITYSYDEEDVGAEADFTNLETTITIIPILTTRVYKDHHVTQIIEPKRVHQALKDLSWIEAMQEELLQFKMQKVCVLVDLPNGKRAIGSKWVFRNKKDKRGIVVRNKARLVTQGHTQEEGIDYEEVFTPVERIEAIRLFLAYTSFMGFMVYQMDVKSVFLYGTIKEEVYVCQPLGFEDPDYPDKVYKVVNVLFGLHQAPRAWYETLANYLLENGFQRGKIDQTLFIKRQKGDILLVQNYVDDIIFGSTNKDLCKAFEKLMKYKFQMSSMGELTLFLGLQVKQKKDRIFISQDK
nr:putative ribonuclease H-like domain-containing protein [Tanacetum cinerariifolium]